MCNHWPNRFCLDKGFVVLHLEHTRGCIFEVALFKWPEVKWHLSRCYGNHGTHGSLRESDGKLYGEWCFLVRGTSWIFFGDNDMGAATPISVALR